MKSVFFILCFLTLPALGTELAAITSSIFEMQLSPLEEEPSTSATTRVKSAIKNSVVQSVSSTATFEAVLDVDIVLQDLKYHDDDQALILQLEVYVTFYQEDTDSTQSLPSQFALDSLITRTFSQPSKKSGFILQLQLSQEASIAGVTSVSVKTIENTSNTTESPSDSNDDSLAILDIVLISTSAIIFAIILYCIYIQQRDSYNFIGYIPSHPIQRKSNRDNEVDHDSQANEQQDSNRMVDDIEQQDSFQTDNDTELRIHKVLPLDYEPESNILCPDESVSFGESNRTESSDYEMSNMESVGSSSASYTSAPEPSQPPTLELPPTPRPDEYLLGARSPSYAHDTNTDSAPWSPLTARLLRLPQMNADSVKSAELSVSSAPARVTLTRHAEESKETAVDEPSAMSARSLSELLKLQKKLFKDDRSLHSASNSTDLAVISEQSIWVAESEEFSRQWHLSTKLAEEAEEDSSEDVFRVDVDLHNNVDETGSRGSALSAVSDWMKSIHVIGRSTDTKTSETSNSSAEHSSIEPKSTEMRETNSTDVSLEKSLATSSVEE